MGLTESEMIEKLLDSGIEKVDALEPGSQEEKYFADFVENIDSILYYEEFVAQ